MSDPSWTDYAAIRPCSVCGKPTQISSAWLAAEREAGEGTRSLICGSCEPLCQPIDPNRARVEAARKAADQIVTALTVHAFENDASCEKVLREHAPHVARVIERTLLCSLSNQDAAQWEAFTDSSYFDMWCVRQVGERRWDQSFHLANREEAKVLAAFLSSRPDAAAERVEDLKREVERLFASRREWMRLAAAGSLPPQTEPDAAARVRELEAEVERLTETVDFLRRNRDALAKGEKTALGLYGLQKQKVKALREALEAIDRSGVDGWIKDCTEDALATLDADGGRDGG